MPWVYIRTKYKFDGPIFGERGDIIVRKNISTCNLLNLLLLFLFFKYKICILASFTPCKTWNIFKVNNKNTRARKVSNKGNNTDIADVVLVSILLNLYSISCYSDSIIHFLKLIASWRFCLLFWCFVPAGINLGKGSTYVETR